jgi:hypothetical protein
MKRRPRARAAAGRAHHGGGRWESEGRVAQASRGGGLGWANLLRSIELNIQNARSPRPRSSDRGTPRREHVRTAYTHTRHVHTHTEMGASPARRYMRGENVVFRLNDEACARSNSHRSRRLRGQLRVRRRERHRIVQRQALVLGLTCVSPVGSVLAREPDEQQQRHERAAGSDHEHCVARGAPALGRGRHGRGGQWDGRR